MEKKLYWLVESNGDLSTTTNSLTECQSLIDCDFKSLDENEQKETQYTITPTYLTDKELSELGETY